MTTRSDLTGAQRSYLRSLAHHLQPIGFIGKNGLTEAALESIATAFDAHELLKVKFIEFKEKKRELAAQIAERTHSHPVGLIGNMAILYREHPDPGKREIALPQ
jgi:RNA-binding protein